MGMLLPSHIEFLSHVFTELPRLALHFVFSSSASRVAGVTGQHQEALQCQ